MCEPGEFAHHGSIRSCLVVQRTCSLTTTVQQLSIDGVLQLLHGIDLQSLGRRLGLEDASCFWDVGFPTLQMRGENITADHERVRISQQDPCVGVVGDT